MRNRAQVLTDLVQLNGSLTELRHELSQFSWDVEEAGFTVTPEHLAKVLSLYSDGKIDAVGLEDWANAIEVREDIEYSEDRIKEIIHELANPLLHGGNLDERISSYEGYLQTLTTT